MFLSLAYGRFLLEEDLIILWSASVLMCACLCVLICCRQVVCLESIGCGFERMLWFGLAVSRY